MHPTLAARSRILGHQAGTTLRARHPAMQASRLTPTPQNGMQRGTCVTCARQAVLLTGEPGLEGQVG